MCSHWLLYWEDKNSTCLPGQKGSDCCLPSTRLGTSLPQPSRQSSGGKTEMHRQEHSQEDTVRLGQLSLLEKPICISLWSRPESTFCHPKSLISPSFIPPNLSQLPLISPGFPSSLWASPHLSSLAYIYPTFSIHVISCSFKPTSLTCLLSWHLPEMPFLLSIFHSAWPPSFEDLVQASLPQRFLNTFQKSTLWKWPWWPLSRTLLVILGKCLTQTKRLFLNQSGLQFHQT